MSIDVKICGLTNYRDAAVAWEAGADYLGFVFFAGSPRYVRVGDVESILQRLGDVKAIGVFVNEPPDEILVVARRLGLFAVQVHGKETSESFRGFPLPLWRALHVTDGFVSPAPSDWPAGRYVVDAAPPGVYGGAGQVADWARARELAAQHPVMLAGGLTPENVVEAVASVQPLGVDVSSGVEASPGCKNPASVKTFITRAKGG